MENFQALGSYCPKPITEPAQTLVWGCMKLIILDLVHYLDFTSAHSKARAPRTSTFLPNSRAGFRGVQAGLLFVYLICWDLQIWLQQSGI